MITAVGKNAVCINGPDGCLYAFHNSPVLAPANTVYLDENGTLKYEMVFNDLELSHQYRALHYERFLPTGKIESTSRIVPYQERLDSSEAGTVLFPLYEVISPTLSTIPGEAGMVLTFWSNLKGSSADLPLDPFDDKIPLYDRNQILKFENLEDVDVDSYTTKILCSASITWEQLRTIGGTVADLSMTTVPIVTHINLLLIQNGELATDFTTPGSGGGIGRHTHSDNANGGFAYAVYAPGTTLQPINWK